MVVGSCRRKRATDWVTAFAPELCDPSFRQEPPRGLSADSLWRLGDREVLNTLLQLLNKCSLFVRISFKKLKETFSYCKTSSHQVRPKKTDGLVSK